MEPKIECKAAHTKFQPTYDDIRCLRCGGDSVSIERSDSSHPECLQLHEDDTCFCEVCQCGWSGKWVAKKTQAKLGMVKCPCCKGTGTVRAPGGKQ